MTAAQILAKESQRIERKRASTIRRMAWTIGRKLMDDDYMIGARHEYNYAANPDIIASIAQHIDAGTRHIDIPRIVYRAYCGK